MKKQSVFLKLGLAFSAVYVLYSAVFFVYYTDAAYQRMIKRSFEQASGYLRIGRIILRDGDVVDLTERLSEGLRAHDIDYFLIRKSGEDLAYANDAGANDPIEFPAFGPEGMYETDTYRHFLIQEGPFELFVGYKVSRQKYLWMFFERSRELILKDIFFVSAFVFFLVLYSFRDLRGLVKLLKSRGVKRADLNFVNSSETLQIVEGLRGYESKIESLADENDLLKGQVLSALQKELWSGSKPPYEFSCTMVRTDINNFTQIFSGEKREAFMCLINDFFVELTHIVSRYNGFVYEFIGDEVIFYFKDLDHLNSAAIAISVVRDINRLADTINERTEVESGFSFRVKSSLAHGIVRFGPLVNGFSLAGGPLIETVRILSHVHSKSENAVLFGGEVNEKISFLCRTRESQIVMLKGLAGARRLYSYEAHVPLAHHLRQELLDQVSNANFYRSDGEICEILDYLNINYGRVERTLSLRLLSLLRTFKLTKTSIEVRISYVDLLRKLLLECGSKHDEGVSYVLASTVAAAPSLFSPQDFVGGLRSALLSCTRSENRRVLANAIDVFAELDPLAGEAIFTDLFRHADNRVLANAIIKEGKRNWSSRVATRLRRMLAARSAYFIASGLYALGELAQYLRGEDPVAFHADRDLQGLIERIAKYAVHPNQMVRRQAFKAMAKAGRRSELSRIASNFKRQDPTGIMAELKDFLSQTDTSKQESSGSRVA